MSDHTATSSVHEPLLSHELLPNAKLGIASARSYIPSWSRRTRRLSLWLSLFSLAFSTATIIQRQWPREGNLPSAAAMHFHQKASHLFGYSPCPDISSPIFPVDTPIYAKQVCQHIPNSHPEFSVEVCTVKATCNTFSVRITRLREAECRSMESIGVQGINATENVAHIMFHNKGPDSFLLRTNGAQRWASEMSVYEGDCRYRFDVTLSNGGDVWLELWWLYSSYKYFDEKTKAWPENHFDAITNGPIRLKTCPERCPMQFAPRLNNDELVLSPSSHYTNLIPAVPITPKCDLDGRVEGIWLPRHPMDVVQPPIPVIPPRKGFSPLMGTYEYTNTICNYDQPGGQFKLDHTACTSQPLKILFAGDSHARCVMYAYSYRLHGHIETFPEVGVGQGPFEYQYDQLNISFWWNTFEQFREWDKAELATYDAIAMSFGSWGLMQYKDTEWFRSHMEDICQFIALAQLEGNHQRTRRNVFVMSPPVPPRTDEAAVNKGDPRTNHKFGLWREIALEILDRYGWRVVDQYARAMPVVLELRASDYVHLSPSAAHASIVDEVLAKMEIC